MKTASLALADGICFEGRTLGYEGEVVGEMVFNTAMQGQLAGLKVHERFYEIGSHTGLQEREDDFLTKEKA